MNAIQFLLKEHEKFRNTLKEINNESHRHSTKVKLFEGLCNELLRHEEMEQKIWYPYLKKHMKVEMLTKHLTEEEKSAGKVIKEFNKVKSEREWQEKFLELKTDVEHHAHEEETKLFPIVTKHIDTSELEIIGKKMRDFKYELTA